MDYQTAKGVAAKVAELPHTKSTHLVQFRDGEEIHEQGIDTDFDTNTDCRYEVEYAPTEFGGGLVNPSTITILSECDLGLYLASHN